MLFRSRPFGRYVYAIGGNPDAAELGGINVRRTLMMTFVLMGILASISATTTRSSSFRLAAPKEWMTSSRSLRT